MKQTRKRFKKPTPEEVTQYAAEKYNWKMDGEKFWAYYESKGWMVGSSKMKNWQAAVLTWYKSAQSRDAVRKAVLPPKTTQIKTATELIQEIENERQEKE